MKPQNNAWLDGHETPLVQCPCAGHSLPHPTWWPWNRKEGLGTFGRCPNPTTLPPPDAPALDSVSCPERITWLEGTEASLSCVAHGVPPPNVSCVRSGEVEVIEGLLQVAREHAGTYRCEATNSQGSVAKDVAITVECEWGQQGAREGMFG